MIDKQLESYKAHLRRIAAQSAVNHARQKAIEQKRQPLPKLNYAAILVAWWNTMPPAVRQHPWSLEVIAAAAFAGQSRRPALRHVAGALRALGFSERRNWTRAGRNRRLWHPPSSFLCKES